MGVESIYRWQHSELVPLEYCDLAETSVEVADSWLVEDGVALAPAAHRERFLGSMGEEAKTATNASAFWDAAIELIPGDGEWFPRVELQNRAGARMLVLRLRSAPPRTKSVTVATWQGADPRSTPRIKGPDLAAMTRIRTAVQPKGAGEAVLLTADGFVVEGAYSALLWWRGRILCAPPVEFDRIESVTAGSVLALAAALGIEVFREAVRPVELAGTELWSLSALHGIRIVTAWIDEPQLAELPGRLGEWRARMDALRKPIRMVSAS